MFTGIVGGVMAIEWNKYLIPNQNMKLNDKSLKLVTKFEHMSGGIFIHSFLHKLSIS